MGSITINELGLYETDVNPSVLPGLDAPIGSLAILDGGAQLWQKSGINPIDWVRYVTVDDLVFTGHFSFKRIRSGKTVVIPEDEQMFVYQNLIIEGELAVYGEVVVR